MEFLAPAAAVAFVALPVIAALYLLKVRGRREPVGSLMLWPAHLADRQADAPWQRLRWTRLLVLQLLVATVAALALMRPGLVGATTGAETTVVVIDGSVSMQATDVSPSRFAAAVSKARTMANRLGATRRMAVVVMGEHTRLLASPTSDPGVLRAALDRARPTGATTDVAEGLALAGAVLKGQPRGSVVLLSDGRFRRPDTPVAMAVPVRFEAIGRTGENLAVRLTGQPGAGSGSVRIAVSNLGATDRDAVVEIRADGRLVDVVEARVEAGATSDVEWSGLPARTTLLETRLAPGDDFGLDDSAWLVTGDTEPRRALVVSEGNGFVTRALSARGDLVVTEVAPADYAGGAYDLYVFDGFLPDGELPGPAMILDPPPGRGPAPVGDAIDPGEVLPGDPRNPLLAFVSLLDVHVQSAAAAVVPPGWDALVEGANGPLVVLGPATVPVVQFNFDIHRSDFPLRPAFPILVQNLLSRLLPGGNDGPRPLGQAIQFAPRAETTGIEVIGPSGRRIRLDPSVRPATFSTDSPGVYEVTEASGGATLSNHFVVGLVDPAQSRIGPGDEPAVRATERASGDPPRATLEIWPWLVAAVLVGLAIEWVLFLRG